MILKRLGRIGLIMMLAFVTAILIYSRSPTIMAMMEEARAGKFVAVEDKAPGSSGLLKRLGSSRAGPVSPGYQTGNGPSSLELLRARTGGIPDRPSVRSIVKEAGPSRNTLGFNTRPSAAEAKARAKQGEITEVVRPTGGR